MLYMHAVQLVPHVPFSLTEHKPRWFANQGDKKVHKFKVWGGRTLELTLAQFWSSLGSGLAGISITFHGVTASTTDLVLDGAQSIARIDITAPETIGSTAVSPSASLTVQRRLLRPKSGASIVPLGERDLFPDEQVRRVPKHFPNVVYFLFCTLAGVNSYVPRSFCSALTSCNRSTS